MVINRDNVTAPTVDKETVSVPILGGDVVVRGLMLSERMALWSDQSEGRFRRIGDLLAMAVLGADGKSLLTAEEWDILGGKHMDDVMAVFAVARRLSGLDVEVAAKN